MAPKKKKNKKIDDWEGDADEIAQERLLTDFHPGERLDKLFVDLIARGKATEADLDRATDELAEGVKGAFRVGVTVAAASYREAAVIRSEQQLIVL